MNRYIPARLAEFEEYRADNGSYRIRLDANESPFLPPDTAVKKFLSAFGIAAVNRYPDSGAAPAVSAFAERYGVKAANVVAGNGSDELISVIAGAFLAEGDRLLTFSPDFSMYSFYASLRGAKVTEIKKNADFEIPLSSLPDIIRDTGASLVMFSNPCNPTGRAYSREEILSAVDASPCLFVVDEAYAEFADRDVSVLRDAPERENLIVLKTLSKAFALASMRCGFAVSCAELAAVLKKVKSPYNVNTMTQLFAKAVLEEKTESDRNIQSIKNEKKRFERELADACGNISLTKTETNFLLIKPAGKTAEEVYRRLLEKGIKVRLLGEYLRITVGLPEENRAFIDELSAITEEK